MVEQIESIEKALFDQEKSDRRREKIADEVLEQPIPSLRLT